MCLLVRRFVSNFQILLKYYYQFILILTFDLESSISIWARLTILCNSYRLATQQTLWGRIHISQTGVSGRSSMHAANAFSKLGHSCICNLKYFGKVIICNSDHRRIRGVFRGGEPAPAGPAPPNSTNISLPAHARSPVFCNNIPTRGILCTWKALESVSAGPLGGGELMTLRGSASR